MSKNNTCPELDEPKTRRQLRSLHSYQHYLNLMHPQPHDELQLQDLHSYSTVTQTAEDLLIKTLENPSWEKTFRKKMNLLKAKKLTG